MITENANLISISILNLKELCDLKFQIFNYFEAFSYLIWFKNVEVWLRLFGDLNWFCKTVLNGKKSNKH
jgi:hypothetical protein